jgi:serine/threonine-protein kinase
MVPVHEIGHDTDGLPYFVMKKLAGTSLSQIFASDEKVPLQHVLRAFVDVCLAVEFAHVRGIVHRDLKPDNIMLGDFGEVYVLDWGVAKVSGEEDGEFSDVDSATGEHATKAGSAIGTPGYMAPEQVRGLADLDGRADIYTLGCLLFEILAGEPLHPRGALGLDSALADRDTRPSTRARNREIPPELDALCVQATKLDRAERIATARELGEAVQRFLDGDRDVALRRSLAREHLERAHLAFTSADGETRRGAMREAASALAIDPSLVGAAELVGRLMLEPPLETPAEVVAEIRREDVRVAKLIAGSGLWVCVAALALMPLAWWIAPGDTTYHGLLIGLLIADGAVGIQLVRANNPRPEFLVVANTLIIFVVSRMFSPILIAPGIAALLAMAMVLIPQFSRARAIIVITVCMAAAVLTPLVLEQVGVLSRTMGVGPSGLLFNAPAIAGRPVPTLVVGFIYVIALIAGAAIAGGVMRAQTRDAHARLQMQAWQLRQLVPAR